jgi:hypothetical protein
VIVSVELPPDRPLDMEEVFGMGEDTQTIAHLQVSLAERGFAYCK